MVARSAPRNPAHPHGKSAKLTFMDDYGKTRGERREDKRRRRRKMGVSGAGVRRLQEIIRDKSQSRKPKPGKRRDGRKAR